MDLPQYVREHTERNACRCGKCAVLVETLDGLAVMPPPPSIPLDSPHTANMVFFDVSLRGSPDKETLIELIRKQRGEFGECDPLGGGEHSYIELGGWIGDQGGALLLMGMGSLLGVWKLLTPYTMMGEETPKELAMQMAGMGLLAVQT